MLNNFVVLNMDWLRWPKLHNYSGQNLLKGQKNDVLASLYSNFILLKRSKFFSTRTVPRFFATNDSFLTTYKNRMSKSEI